MSIFSGKTAIVTGGASGIGRELCLELAKSGAKVYVADINEKGSVETVSSIARAGGKAASIVTDMRDPDAVARLVSKVTAEGVLDYMFNNAGVIMFGEFRDMSFEDWRHFIDSDIMGVVYGTAVAYKAMREQGHGHIVNVSSVFGLFPFALATGYAAMKQAVVGLSLSLRPEAAGFGVNVSVACPGSVKTEVRKSYRIFNGDREAFNALIWKEMSPNQAALKILVGVRKNKGLIAFPFYDLFPWWLYRIHPSLNYRWQGKLVNLFRSKVRCNP
ncbi:MAG: SDR family oxidoreductase [Deltaproteobacteria bacterium]|nr:SDR family oxidoreductase [Deltaproteobacteria bacterium]